MQNLFNINKTFQYEKNTTYTYIDVHGIHIERTNLSLRCERKWNN